MSPLRLDAIPLNEIDRIMLEAHYQKYTQMLLCGAHESGEVTTNINVDGSGKTWMKVTTQGRQDFALFNVFVAKIRQESEGLSNAMREQRAAWLNMTNAFIDHFGKAKTPPDIIKYVADLTKEYFH